MSREIALLPRPRARLLAGTGAVAAFGLAAYTSAVESMPEFRIYDGYWMMLGAAVAVLLTAPLVWRLRREVSLPIVVVAAVLGSWAPIAFFALRKGMSVLGRMEGARYLMAGDVVCAATAVGVACTWMLLREAGRR